VVLVPSPSPRLLLALVLLASPAGADEGFWTFDDPPLDRLRAHGFAPSPEWLERLRLASLRFMDGGSGFVASSSGLAVTNHHVALGCLQKLSRPGRDLVADGYYARRLEDEQACPGYEVGSLVGSEDVTAQVTAGTGPELSDREAADRRKAAIARLRNACAEATGHRCDVVSLHQGGEYRLYRYRTYTDVRLVFAPEQEVAFFGGETDNFTYPRHDLDFCVMRLYENGRPARPAAFLPLSRGGAREGELVFVSGHPWSSARNHTMAQLASERAVLLPAVLRFVRQRLRVLEAYAAREPEARRRARESIFAYENSRKAFEGRAAALQNEDALRRKKEDEQSLISAVRADPGLAARIGDPWAQIAAARARADTRVDEMRFVGFGGSDLLKRAGTILRWTEEVRKPNEERLEEFVDSALASLRNELLAEVPVHDDLEQVMLADQLQQAREALGPEHPFVRAALGGRTPEEAARAAVGGSRLAEPGYRRDLLDAGPEAVAASTDTMIDLARRIDPLAREVRRFRDDDLRAVVSRASERIAQARFHARRGQVYPDATFTLRLAYGFVKGYSAQGTQVPPFTTFHGLYDRSLAFGGRAPFRLPPRWRSPAGGPDLATPLNFVCTADAIGGNSGSPIVNAGGEVVGVLFDGNIESLAWDYFYTEERARAVAVDVRAVRSTLRTRWKAGRLLEELD
jgi:hypothetical protein